MRLKLSRFGVEPDRYTQGVLYVHSQPDTDLVGIVHVGARSATKVLLTLHRGDAAGLALMLARMAMQDTTREPDVSFRPDPRDTV